MIKKYLLIIILISVIFLIDNHSLLAYGASIQWFEDSYYLSSKFRLLDDSLYLPEKELHTFDLDVRDELINLVTIFGERERNPVPQLALIYEPDFLNTRYEIDLENEKEQLSLISLPGVEVNAEHQKNLDDLELEENTNISLKYQLNPNVLFRAEYDILSKEWWDLQEIKQAEGPVREPGETEDNDEEIEVDDPQEYYYATKEAVYNLEKTEKSRVGIAYQTSDYLTVFADYINEDFEFDSDFSTAFGLEYNDKHGKVKYQYQIGFGETKETVSGLEFGFKDLATFNASYKVLNPDLLKDQLKESTWNFDFDVTLNEISSLSLGYELKSNEDNDKDESSMGDKESNIKAELKFKF